jgi:ABC-type branched-subunit amino acid transport system permease subunit
VPCWASCSACRRGACGDYLAIVTLFFGQVFVELVVNLDRVTLPGEAEPVDITGGPNGIAGVDPIQLLGVELLTPTDYFYLSPRRPGLAHRGPRPDRQLSDRSRLARDTR